MRDTGNRQLVGGGWWYFWFSINMKWEIEFYQDSQGNIPVQAFILQQPAKVKAKFIHYIDMLQDFGLSLGQPYVKKLKDDV